MFEEKAEGCGWGDALIKKVCLERFCLVMWIVYVNDLKRLGFFFISYKRCVRLVFLNVVLVVVLYNIF